MSTSAPQLPIELYRQIVLDPELTLHDLYSLSLTTHDLSSEAYSALYTRVELRTIHETELALRTFLESDRIVKMVRILSLRPLSQYRIDFGRATPVMTRAIHRMENLRELTLGYLWTSDPFGENSGAGGQEMIAGGNQSADGGGIAQQQVGPRGPGRTAWTRALKIPNIEKLTLDSTTYRPVRDLFGALPNPLPHLVAIRPMHVRDLVGIRRVSCERVYGRTGEGHDADDGTLKDLEVLEVMNFDSYSTQGDWAPNLKTVAMIAGEGRGEYFITSRSFEYMKTVRFIGPVVCYEASKDFLEETSQLQRLEGMVLILPRITYRDFDVSDMERMKRAVPSLLWLALVPSDRNHPGVFREYTKWSLKEKEGEIGADDQEDR
ncbi:hypothetical protein M408DRAFT_28321 [Serendipita vermifera MAFF 305830]|uniref:Uncharacterized protein n=1 Tax=Serendipita vermifera MAFF 305830 TaxID=933852 RepID=A0A0C3ASG4_SERVB|nr:hypothetical protein M408DRAFT_28321 [Serendipita vermifera MAFF 305830]